MTQFTRDEKFPPRVANLIMAFSRCSEGHTIDEAINAGGNFLAHAMFRFARARGLSDDAACDMAAMVLQAALDNFVDNIESEGEAQPNAIPVHLN